MNKLWAVLGAAALTVILGACASNGELYEPGMEDKDGSGGLDATTHREAGSHRDATTHRDTGLREDVGLHHDTGVHEDVSSDRTEEETVHDTGTEEEAAVEDDTGTNDTGTNEDVTPRDTGTDEDVTPRDTGTNEDVTPRDTGTNEDVTPRDTGGSNDAPMPRDAPSDVRGPSDTGPDTPVCTNQCTLGAEQCANGNTDAQTCETQSSGCTAWVTTTVCGPHQTCSMSGSNASCGCESSVCTENGNVCEGSQTVATCATDGNSCLYVASTMTCQGTEACAGSAPNSACAPTCTNTCMSGHNSCGAGGTIEICTLQTNGCYALAPAAACTDPNQTCTGSAGAASCTCKLTAPCTVVGTVCSGSSAYVTCDKNVSDGCIVEASSTPCGARETCSGVAGSALCKCTVDPICSSTTDECSGNTAVSCAQDAQGCYYESLTTNCTTARSGGETCYGGQCVGVCSPSSPPQCDTTNTLVQTCGPQGTWVTSKTCTGLTPFCSGGACVECLPGTTQCSTTALEPSGVFAQSCQNGVWVNAGPECGVCQDTLESGGGTVAGPYEQCGMCAGVATCLDGYASGGGYYETCGCPP